MIISPETGKDGSFGAVHKGALNVNGGRQFE
jgi:hypothetical protein